MSEGLASVYKGNSEPRQTEMAAASCIQGKSSLLPLKRKTCDHSTSLGDISDYPCSKRFLNEELMASHLEHLKLSHESQVVNYTSSFGPTPNSRQLSIKTVASCPHSMDTKVARKRYLTESSPESEGPFKDDYFPDFKSKRARICTDTKMPRESMSLHSTKDMKTECVVPQNRQDIMCVPMLSVGSISDLSSIPEETELSRQSSSSSCDSPTPDTEEERHWSCTQPHLDPRSTMASTFLSPSPATPPLASGVDLGTKPCSVWIAPELQAIQRHSKSLLPVPIINEIKSRAMAVVPWVGLESLLQGQECKASNDEASLEPNSNPSLHTKSVTANHQSRDQSHDCEDSGMELN